MLPDACPTTPTCHAVPQLSEGVPCSYARQKFLAAEGLSQDCPPGQLAEHLPRTRAFLAAASGKLPRLEAALPASSSSSQPSTVPSELRTGLRATGPARSAEQGAKQPAARLELGVLLKSWRGLVGPGGLPLWAAQQCQMLELMGKAKPSVRVLL